MTDSTKDFLMKLLRGLDVLERRVASFGAESDDERETVEAALRQIEKMRNELRREENQSEDRGS